MARPQVTPDDAQRFLTHVLTSGGKRRKRQGRRTAATRNRKLVACRKFYKWALSTDRVDENPFAAIKALKEEEPEEIVYCTAAERDELLKSADSVRGGIALWIAFYAGLRRGEIQRIKWDDVVWTYDRLIVRKTKTARRRVVPMASALRARLERSSRQHGRIVPWPSGYLEWNNAADRLIAKLRRQCADVAILYLNEGGQIVGRLLGPGDEMYRIEKTDGNVLSVPRGDVAEIGRLSSGQIRWNAFRHTFGSLLAQKGVSLDKISAWMGNSPEICRRHYAEFVPRDAHDEDIEKL